MTWSILGRDEHGRLGAAVASRFFAVGALCLHTRRGVGALSTQALLNPLYGPAGLDRLSTGESAAEVVRALTAADAGRAHRQLHVLPAADAAANRFMVPMTLISCIERFDIWVGSTTRNVWMMVSTCVARTILARIE